MKVSSPIQKIHLTDDAHIFAADIGKDRISWLICPAKVGSAAAVDQAVTEEIANASLVIRHCLVSILSMVDVVPGKVIVACEPTGSYHRKLMREAETLGMQVILVSGRAVHRLEALEANDNGKSDARDPRVIAKLVLLRSGLLTLQSLPEPYAALRVLHGQYDRQTQQLMELRCRLHPALLALFPDLDLSSEQLRGGVGQALGALYKCNPWEIRSAGREKFMAEMKKKIAELKYQSRKATLEAVWSQAEASTDGSRPPETVLSALEQDVSWLMEDIARLEARKLELRRQIDAAFAGTREARTLESITCTHFDKARIVAETGPLDGYQAGRQVLRMAGLGIRICESGKYKGQDKIAKTGRALLRKCLFQIVFSLCGPKTGFLHDRYRRLMERVGGGRTKGKAAPGGAGKKRMVQLMRKLLLAVFAIHRSGQQFRKERLFEQEPRKKAA